MWRLDELIVKGAVAAGSTSDSSWAGPLAPQQTLAGEFVEYLRPATIIGRIPGLRNVPFNVKFGEVTADVSAAFVGQGKPYPASALSLATPALAIAQLVIITPLTLELAQDSSPHAAATIAADCRAALAAGLEEAFVDPDRVAVTDTSAFRRAQR
ncbi:MAG: hypothetical protein E6H66_23215 [Betaproteobacteria bacterium]|nr:MAG: hypothetical protein E6H66_23215 [Betaproteobacteria bacterium]